MPLPRPHVLQVPLPFSTVFARDTMTATTRASSLRGASAARPAAAFSLNPAPIITRAAPWQRQRTSPVAATEAPSTPPAADAPRSRRCFWAQPPPAALGIYHDEEWGRAPAGGANDAWHFEFLTLEGAQAGLSWATILKKREGYRAAFRGFAPAGCAMLGDEELREIAAGARGDVVRHRGRWRACVGMRGCSWTLLRSLEAGRGFSRTF